MSDFEYDGTDLEVMSFAVGYHGWILDEMRAYIRGRVAEIGAGVGSFSELILKIPSVTRLIAIEPARAMYERLADALRDDARAEARNEFFAAAAPNLSGTLDSLVYVNVLEHIPDDAAEMRHAFSALKSGGHVCIFVPALPWLMSEHDRVIGHHRRYTKTGLEALLTAAGFVTVKSRYFDFFGIIPWFLLMRVLKQRPAAGAVSVYDSCVVPIERFFESVIAPPVGKNVLLIARKP